MLVLQFFQLYFIVLQLYFPGGSDGKESACNAGDLGLIPGSGRSPAKGNGTHHFLPLKVLYYPVFLPEKSHGQRSLVSYRTPVVSNSLQPHGLQPTRLLCSWNSPTKRIFFLYMRKVRCEEVDHLPLSRILMREAPETQVVLFLLCKGSNEKSVPEVHRVGNLNLDFQPLKL